MGSFVRQVCSGREAVRIPRGYAAVEQVGHAAHCQVHTDQYLLCNVVGSVVEPEPAGARLFSWSRSR